MSAEAQARSLIAEVASYRATTAYNELMEFVSKFQLGRVGFVHLLDGELRSGAELGGHCRLIPHIGWAEPATGYYGTP